MSVDLNRLVRQYHTPNEGAHADEPDGNHIGKHFTVAVTNELIYATPADKRVAILSVLFSSAVDNVALLHYGVGPGGPQAIIPSMFCVGEAGYNLPMSIIPYWIGEQGQQIFLNTSGAGRSSIHIEIVEMD